MFSPYGPPRRTVLALVATTAAASLALVGCSSSGGGSGGTPSSSAAGSTSQASAQGKLASLVPASIKSKGTLTFAMDATYPPDESIGSDGKTIQGLDADLANALAGELGLKAQLQNVSFDSIIPGIQDGKYDVGMSSFTDSKVREKQVDFVTYFQAGEGFYVKAGSGKKFTDKASLCGAKVSVEKGTIEQDEATAQAKSCPSGKKLTVLVFGDQNAANLAVSSGRADVGYADSQVASYIVKQSNGQFESTGSPFEVSPYGIAFQKNSPLVKAFLAAVKALMADGTYKSILAKWGEQSGAITTPTVNGAIS